MIENRQFHIKRREFSDARSLPEVIADTCGPNVLRWYIAQANAHEVVVEATLFDEMLARLDEPGDRPHYPGKHVVLSVAPTGVGCDIGGYAGDEVAVTS